MTFTVTNNDSAAHMLSGATNLYGLQPGKGATIEDDDSDAPNLPDGTSCRGDDSDLQPGAHTRSLHTCFAMPNAQLAGPFKLIWSIDNVGGTIDLSHMAVSG